MKIHYEITLDDLIAWNLYHSGHSSTIRRLKARNLWGAPVLWMLIGGGLSFLTFDGTALPFMVFLLPVSVCSVVWLVVVPSYLRRKTVRLVRKLYCEGAPNRFPRPQEMELTATRLIERTPVQEQSVVLHSIEKIARAPEHTFIYVSAVAAFIIPRAALGEREYEEFVDGVEKAVAKAKGG